MTPFRPLTGQQETAGQGRDRVLTPHTHRVSAPHKLLHAAHIVPDRTEVGGEPVVPNGLALCKIHHAAFDANILGIRPDYVAEIRSDVLAESDGPMLRYGIQEVHNMPISVPRSPADQPDRARLELR